MSSAQTLATRSIYQGRIFTVTVDRVRLPHGPEVDLTGATVKRVVNSFGIKHFVMT